MKKLHSHLDGVVETAQCRYGIFSYIKSDVIIGRSLKEYGEWAQREIDFLLSLIEPGDVVVDVGACIGTHTLAFASKVGNNGKVYAFEPQKTSFDLLELNVKQNMVLTVQLFNVALSKNRSPLYAPKNPNKDNNPGGVALLTETSGSSAGNDLDLVKTDCLDNYDLAKCKLVKIDVEGMEKDVLDGACNFLARLHPLVYVECLSVENGANVLDFMRGFGYEGFLHSILAYNPENFNGNKTNFWGIAREVSIIFVPKEYAFEFRLKTNKEKGLIHLVSLDDLVFGLLKKPQYKEEVLSKTHAAQITNYNFWLNEPEAAQLTEHIEHKEAILAEKEQTIQGLMAKIDQTEHDYKSMLAEEEQTIQGLTAKVGQIDQEYKSTLTEKEQTIQGLMAKIDQTEHEYKSILAEKEQTIQALMAKMDQTEHEYKSILAEKEQTIQVLMAEADQKEWEYKSTLIEKEQAYHDELNHKTQIISTLFSRLANKEKAYRDEYNEKLDSLNSENHWLSEKLALSVQDTSVFSSQLWEIKHSRAWRLVENLWKFRIRFFPAGSIQTRVARLTLRGLRVLKNQGPISFIKQAVNKFISILNRGRDNTQPITTTAIQTPEALYSIVHPNPVYIPDQKIEKVKPNFDFPPASISLEPNKSARLWEQVVNCIKYKDFLVSISHDDYLAVNFGGVQMFMADEQKLYDKREISYIHLYPVNETNYLKEDSSSLLIGLNVDSYHIGHYSLNDVVTLFERLLAENHTCVSLNLHHLKGWTSNVLNSVINTIQPVHHLFFIHDYFAVCPQYNLLRNELEFCNAPTVDSNACTICAFGEKRKKHLPQVKQLFTNFPFLVIAPSKSAERMWQKAFPGLQNEVRIEPHLLLRETAHILPANTDAPIRIAYAGQGVRHKGWESWRTFVDQFASEDDYRMFHLGIWSGDNREAFHSIRVTSKNRTAMQDALRKNEIDILFHWPIWPETFSYVLYEAINAGCFVITSNRSGNVVDYVRENKNGVVFDTFQEMVAYLSKSDIVRKDLMDFRRRYPKIFTSEINDSIANLVKMANHSGSEK